METDNVDKNQLTEILEDLDEVHQALWSFANHLKTDENIPTVVERKDLLGLDKGGRSCESCGNRMH